MPLVKRNKKKTKLSYKISACYLSEEKYNIKGKFRYKFNDIDIAMFEIMMSMIIEFVEEEGCFECCDWSEYCQDIESEIRCLYRFAKNYTKWIKRMEDEYSTWLDPDGFDMFDEIIENKIHYIEDQMMTRMINIRHFLWT